MIEIICGEKGKGKTKELLEKVNHTSVPLPGVLFILTKARNICMS